MIAWLIHGLTCHHKQRTQEIKIAGPLSVLVLIRLSLLRGLFRGIIETQIQI